MRQRMFLRGGKLLAIVTAAVLALAVGMQGKAFAVTPSIEEVELKGKDKVEVNFVGDVEYKKVRVTVKNPNGKKYRAKIVIKDDDDLTFKLRKHKSGKTYRFTISGIRSGYAGKYGKVKSSITIPKKERYIGKKKALAVALKDAGLRKSQVRDINVELEKENGIYVYEVGFQTGSYEYDYDIRATDGKILKREKEKED